MATKERGRIHPITGIRIYKNGTCGAPVGYNRSGYKIYYSKKGAHTLHVHVAELFIPNPENKPIVNHKNGKKYNPRASNLEWATYSENSIHAHKMGLNRKKLTPKDVIAIRKSKLPEYRICFKYDVGENHINNIRKRISWKHIS